jgi:peptide/nickel transport system substrate-binding protein
VENVFGSLALPAIGPVPRTLGTADTTLRQIPFDIEGSRRILDSLGWKDSNGDGVREKGRRLLEFGILVPSSSRPRGQFAVLLQEAFRQVGAKVNVESAEFTTVSARLSSRNFETTLGLWQVDPSPGGVRQTWGTEGSRAKGGLNAGSYESTEFDALVDSALKQMDPVKERAYLKRAYQTIIDDAPAIFLYEPRLTAGAHKRINPVGMRADAWWANLAATARATCRDTSRVARPRTIAFGALHGPLQRGARLRFGSHCADARQNTA